MADLGERLLRSSGADQDDGSGIELSAMSDPSTPMMGGAGTGTGSINASSSSTYVISELRDAKQYSEAAIFLQEGFNHLPLRFHPRTARQQKLFVFYTSFWNRLIEGLIAAFYILLVLFEQPAVHELPYYVTGSLEMLCAIYFAYNLHLRARICGGWNDFLRPCNRYSPKYKGVDPDGRSVAVENIVRIAIICVVVAGAIFTLVNNPHASGFSIIRPLLILDTTAMAGVRRVLRQVMFSLWHIRWMMCLLLVFILISSILAFFFFHENPDEQNFHTLEDSFINMFILSTTANYPDVMMHAFAYTKAAPVFFVIYLVLGLYIIFNVFLAFVFDFYQSFEKNKFKRLFLDRRVAVRKAFQQALASDEAGLTMRAYREIMVRYQRNVSTQDIVLSFKLMDTSGDGSLSEEEFQSFYRVFNLHWQVDYLTTIGHDYIYKPTKDWPSWRLAMRSFVEHKYFNYFIDITIVANLIYILAEAVCVSKDSCGLENETQFQYIFFAIFIAEAIVKIVALTPRAYFHDSWNTFDFIIVAISASLFIIEAFVDAAPVGLFATVVRGFRLARIFKTHETFKQVAEVIAFLLPKMARFYLALLLVYFVFAVIGMQSFAGVVTNCTPERCGQGSYYAPPEDPNSTHFQLISFDNILYSLNTLFHLMVINNWQVTMSGHAQAIYAKAIDSGMSNAAASTRSRFARSYFFIYYLVTVIVVSNVIIAFILDAFQILYDMRASNTGTESPVYKRRIEKLEVSREVAMQFLPEDDPAVNEPVITFVAKRRDAAIYDLLYAEDIKQWAEEDRIEAESIVFSSPAPTSTTYAEADDGMDASV
eukprot:m.35112 g.35112  ORF g.35112 m.35112 type:complete len:821 (-) comp9847_c0_seq3:346-2808(-)